MPKRDGTPTAAEARAAAKADEAEAEASAAAADASVGDTPDASDSSTNDGTPHGELPGMPVDKLDTATTEARGLTGFVGKRVAEPGSGTDLVDYGDGDVWNVDDDGIITSKRK